MIDGSRPKNIPECEKVNKRIELSPKGEEYLSALLSSGEFKSKAELITTALAYLAEQPAWVYQLGATTI
ncbi:hypothetical protein [Desulfospira joergensenii]|uniref:hypothetical protein n=1 Tax=Desulfospira joergensenii TaxID=53329 RepID=UPI00048915D4|nr:hypothetical protein [Desulfospira joergensenii]